MNDLLKTDSLLAIMALALGLVSSVEEFWQKLVLIVFSVGMVVLRAYLKSKEKWRG